MNENNSLVPKIRFSEFAETWIESKLEDLGVFKKGKLLAKKDLTQEGVPCILYGELYTKYNEVAYEIYSKTGVSTDNLFLSKSGDVILPSSGETAIDISTATCVMKDDVAFGGDLNVFRTNKIDGRFLSYALNHSHKYDIAKVAQGNSVVHLYNSSLSKLKVKYPNMKEQTRIVEFLGLINDKISILESSIEHLEIQKKGFLQKIFSQELRFKETDGNGFPEWKKIQIGEVLIDNLIPVPKPENDYMRLGLRSHFRGTFHELVEEGKGITVDTLYKVEKDNLIVNITFAWEHAIAITDESDEGKLVSHRFPTYKFKENVHPQFMKYVIGAKRFKYDMGVASPGGAGRNKVLNKTLFKEIPVVLPCIEEQRKIADFISSYDQKIEVEKVKLEHWKQIKRGLLDKMFV